MTNHIYGPGCTTGYCPACKGFHCLSHLVPGTLTSLADCHPPPCGGERCWRATDGTWVHSGLAAFPCAAYPQGDYWRACYEVERGALDALDGSEAALVQQLAAARKATDDAYAERNQVVALLARMALAMGWRAGLKGHEPDPDPEWEDDWKNVVAIDLPTGQVTWHYHDSDRPLFSSLPPYAGSWDGHDTPEKYRRVNEAAPAQPATMRALRTALDCLAAAENILRAIASSSPDDTLGSVKVYTPIGKCRGYVIDLARAMFDKETP